LSPGETYHFTQLTIQDSDLHSQAGTRSYSLMITRLEARIAYAGGRLDYMRSEEGAVETSCRTRLRLRCCLEHPAESEPAK
jgi:hypothetical protein